MLISLLFPHHRQTEDSPVQGLPQRDSELSGLEVEFLQVAAQDGGGHEQDNQDEKMCRQPCDDHCKKTAEVVKFDGQQCSCGCPRPAGAGGGPPGPKQGPKANANCNTGFSKGMNLKASQQFRYDCCTDAPTKKECCPSSDNIEVAGNC